MVAPAPEHRERGQGGFDGASATRRPTKIGRGDEKADCLHVPNPERRPQRRLHLRHAPPTDRDGLAGDHRSGTTATGPLPPGQAGEGVHRAVARHPDENGSPAHPEEGLEGGAERLEREEAVQHAEVEQHTIVARPGQGGRVALSSGSDHESEIRCAVERFDFSGHAPREQLVNYAVACSPKTVILVHGDESARGWFLETLGKKLPDTRIVIPAPGHAIDL